MTSALGPRSATAGLLLLSALVGGCVGPGLLTDGTTVSVGTHARGALRHGEPLAFRGRGYVIPARWKARKRNYGTEELTRLLRRTAARVAAQYRRSLLGIADLSPRGGGPTPEHGSHRSGRDVDLLFYATDLRGRPVPPAEMVRFNARGESVPPASRPATSPAVGPPTPGASANQPAYQPLRFDVRRNWAMVKALVTDPEVPVQWIFIGRPMIRLLLAHARRRKEPSAVVERAALVMHQPGDAGSHTDHCHVRIFCAPSDRYQGCVDRGPQRWLKKTIKYLDAPAFHPPISRALKYLTWPHSAYVL